MITAEEFGSWKHDVITKYVLEYLAEMGSDRLEVILSLGRNSTNTGDMCQVAYNTGVMEGISIILELKPEDLGLEESNEDDVEGVG
jgi:hypothetical protein